MLTLTENASTIVKDITSQPGLAETAGLRITSEDAPEPTFAVSAAEAPEPGDQTVEQDGARSTSTSPPRPCSTTRSSTRPSTRPARWSSPWVSRPDLPTQRETQAARDPGA